MEETPLAPSPYDRLDALCRRLLAEGGCPWDREQTPRSLTPYLVEETFEVVEAIGAGDPAKITEEMGDLLYLLVFLLRVLEKHGVTEAGRTADVTIAKLVSRHPHVFATARDLSAVGAVRQWEDLKRDENAGAGWAHREPHESVPATILAFRFQEKAGAVGFDWPDVSGVLDKIVEEVEELRERLPAAAKPGAGDADGDRAREEEIGDLLFAIVNAARHLGVDPERALRLAARKFQRRFAAVEAALAARGKSPAGSTLEEMEALWQAEKRREGGRGPSA